MSDNLSLFRSRIVIRLEDQSVDEDLHHLPDQPGSVGRCSCSLRTDRPGFFQSIFSSLRSGKEVSLTLIINDSDIIWNKTRLIGINN